MPSSLIGVNLIVCERVLSEQDKVLSAIRIVDAFYYSPIPEVPLEHQAVRMSVLVVGKVAKESELLKHSLELKLMRPDGTSTKLGEHIVDTFESHIPEAPGGFNIVAQIGVVPKQPGTHYFSLSFDGEEVARTPFTLIERKTEQTE